MSVPATGVPKVLLFDVNESLLSLEAVEENVNKLLLENGAAKLWFTTMLQYSLVLTVSGEYRPFPEIGAAALRMLARNRDVMLSEDDVRKALEPMKSALAHADVAPALAALRDAGFRMATLTNSTSEGSKTQLQNAGIAGFFERQLSVESVRKYKPHRDVYLWAAEQMHVQPADCMLIAAHPWDVAGAAWAGMRTGYLARVGVALFPIAPAPEIEALDLGDLAKRLGATSA